MEKEKGKRKLQENSKRKEQRKITTRWKPNFGLKNQQEWRMADHNGSTDVSTTPLLGVLDTNHHVSHVCTFVGGAERHDNQSDEPVRHCQRRDQVVRRGVQASSLKQNKI